ncbi:MAG: hypothetical protein ACD_46C00043G0002 [uncultured bacterium]|nr:MAG: hypothetical protein ACD_46C00043G0002 [uncultured bacterium]
MKKLFLPFLILFLSTSVFANVKNLEITQNKMIASDNSTDWEVKQSGDYYNIQNITGKAVRVDVFIDKIVKGTVNTPSDSVYVLCSNVATFVQPGTDFICDIAYPGRAIFLPHPFANGATGRFSIIY